MAGAEHPHAHRVVVRRGLRAEEICLRQLGELEKEILAGPAQREQLVVGLERDFDAPFRNSRPCALEEGGDLRGAGIHRLILYLTINIVNTSPAGTGHRVGSGR